MIEKFLRSLPQELSAVGVIATKARKDLRLSDSIMCLRFGRAKDFMYDGRGMRD